MFASFARADDIARQEIIIELFRVMQYENMIDRMSDVAAGHIIDQIKSERPTLDVETETELRDLTRDFSRNSNHTGHETRAERVFDQRMQPRRHRKTMIGEVNRQCEQALPR